MEIKQDSDNCACFTTHGHGCKVDIVAVSWIPVGPELHETRIAGVEIEEAHVEILGHL